MARPKSFDRDLAIDIAMDTLWRNGFTASSVKSLSETLGITRSSFYNAFGSWEGLLEEVFERYFNLAPSHRLFGVTPATSVRPFLTALYHEICQVRASDPEGRGCLGVNFVAEVYPGGTAISQAVEEGARSCIDQFRKLLEWGIESGELPADTDVKAKALALQNLMMGLNIMSKLVREEADLWACARTTLNGLGLYDPETRF